MHDFVPPPAPAVSKQITEFLAQQQKQLTGLNVRFNASEEERKKAWKKTMKTKAETQPEPISGRRGRTLDLSNYHLIPVPALRNSGQQIVPRYEHARSAVATYTPPSTSYAHGAGGSESKYSAARVKERISNDGTVAPVTEPKRTADGLYQRPAGRTRKGMQWDAMRGIWVPDGTL